VQTPQPELFGEIARKDEIAKAREQRFKLWK